MTARYTQALAGAGHWAAFHKIADHCRQTVEGAATAHIVDRVRVDVLPAALASLSPYIKDRADRAHEVIVCGDPDEAVEPVLRALAEAGRLESALCALLLDNANGLTARQQLAYTSALRDLVADHWCAAWLDHEIDANGWGAYEDVAEGSSSEDFA